MYVLRYPGFFWFSDKEPVAFSDGTHWKALTDDYRVHTFGDQTDPEELLHFLKSIFPIEKKLYIVDW